MHLKGTMAAALFVATTVGAAHAQTISAGGYSLTVIGDLGGPRNMRYNGHAVSADGKTIIGSYWSDVQPGGSTAFSWSATTGWQRLAAPANAYDSQAQTVSADGQVIGGSISARQADSGNLDRWAVRWPGDGRIQKLVPDTAGWGASVEVANLAGTRMTGSFTATGGRNARFMWDQPRGFRELPPGGDYAVQLLSMTSSGNAATGFAGNVDGVYGSRALLWTERFGERLLPTISAGLARMDMANGVTEDERTIAGSLGTLVVTPDGQRVDSEAVLWTNGGDTLQRLGFLDGDNSSYASSISTDGRVVIGASSNGQDDARVFVWTPQSGMRSLVALLEAAGLSAGTLNLTNVIGVSPDGQTITGQGYREDDPDGRPQFWQVHIDAATLRALRPASPGADALPVRASQPKAMSRMLAAKPNAAMRRDVCRMPVTPARLAQCRSLVPAAR
ncbi:calcium-binding protein [Burkholderia lata]|uniref:Calcium-binding protein n=1 Tax=Burkholderia lata (strain ATCC 17760 / DSM 23089 / LMG 22485 / NCIMB 9086 / R18194 / 383) TaxID=482957 RepID=A0A6P2VBR3_BURL3|nr:calcium-binding protein [Burkholderia lata]VWC77680.1 calcium-binding protein [Burkholderia lata]